MEDLIEKKLRETETRIVELENELLALVPESPPEYTDYDRTDRLQEDWLVVDAHDASLGPSAWKLQTSTSGGAERGIHQTSSITSSTGLGTHLILRHRQYNKGFIAARVKISDTGYGQFGFLVKYTTDKDFIALEISKPSTGQSSTIGIRRMRDGKLGIPENVITYELPSSQWIQLAADFGTQSIRFFVDNGKLKSGLALDTPVSGGFLGFFTRALGTNSQLVFDNVMTGPLSSQATLGIKHAFGSEAERLNEAVIHVQEGGQLEEVPAMSTTVSAAQSIPLDKTIVSTPENKSLPEGVFVQRDPMGCVREYKDPLLVGVHSEWAPSVLQSDPTEGTPAQFWNQASQSSGGYLIGRVPTPSGITSSAATVTPSNAVLLTFKERPCLGRFSLSVEVRLKEGAQGGLSFRGRTPNDYCTVYLDMTTNTGPQVVLYDVKHGVGQQYTTGTRNGLDPDTWYRLTVDDTGSFVRVMLNRDTVLQIRLADNTAGQQGLIVLNGIVDFRNFQFIQSDHPSTETV